MAFNKARALQEAEKLVTQGKLALAIKQYQDIAENEPSDLNLLNTIGDLCVRERNISKALEQFHKIAATYVREGFTVKAIAMYKKISKLDPTAAEPILKLGELYQLQGLARESREQYVQAVDFYRKKKQNDKALEVLRMIVRLDPDNTTVRLHLGEFCEVVGLKEDAAKTYLETSQVALRRKDTAAAEAALKKLAALNPNSSRVHLLEAQVSLTKQQPAKAEKIISSDPELKARPEGRRILLEAYLGSHKLEAAQSVVSEVYRSSPADFSPLAAFAALCFEKGNYDAALQPLAAAADELIAQGNTGQLMECLRRIWEKRPHDIPLLELMYRVGERTEDEVSLPELLEALGHAYVQAGELEKAEVAYRKLSEREPENEGHRGMLKQVLQKLGKDVVVAGSPHLTNVEMALSETEAAVSLPAAVDAEEAAMVKEAIENSDLYYRYGSVDKALAELEKALAEYPDQIDIHKRIIEVCQRKQPARAVVAKQTLARIYAKRGDQAKAKKYEEMTRQDGAVLPAPMSATPGVEIKVPPAPAASTTAAPEHGLSTESTLRDEVIAPGASLKAPPPAAQAEEVDLSTDWEAAMAPSQSAKAEPAESAKVEPPLEPQPPQPQAPALNYQETEVEIKFYLENGFLEEARKAVEELEQRFPGNSQVAELRGLVEKHASAAAEARASASTSPEPAPAVEIPEIVLAEPDAEEKLSSGRESPFSPPPVQAPVPAASSSRAAAPAESNRDFLGNLAGDLAASLDGIEAAAPPPPPSPPSPRRKAKPAKAKAAEPASPLSGLLEDLHELVGQQESEGDPETHYSLGVAFREMGLLDEAIGEFQKVVKGALKDKLPPNFLQACTLLAICFMDKKMPAIATKWYLRALEVPGLGDDAVLALQYDLGVAYEEAGDTRTALEKFTEVYSQNIDFRDVAEKIRQLQQKNT